MRDDERLRQAIRVGNIGIFDHDHAADVIFWSLELRQIYGWDPDEPVTLPKIISHIHPDDAQRVVAAVKHAHDPAGDGAFDTEHRIVDRSGAVRWVLMRSRTLFGDVGGQRRPTRTIGAVQDVTHQRIAEERLRRLEDQLRQAQKMESIGRLAGGIAHDFNNFLTVVAAGLDLALASLPSPHPSREHLAVVTDAARSASALTRQLLAFSRQEMIAPKILDLNDVIARTQDMLRRLIGEDIVLETIRGEHLTPVRFDPGQVEQILVNLAANARDAMPGGGRLTIETRNIVIDGESAAQQVGVRAGAYALLLVSDNGVGMSEPVRTHLFEPFFTTKPRGQGTGLGLAMVYGAVQQNGGRIEVCSEVDRGTTFRIYLPAADGMPEPALARTPSAGPGRRATVLLVEDDARVRRLTAETLARLGHDVHSFACGDEALRALSSLHPVPDLLITDVVMPGMNGLVLAEKVAAVLPGLRVLFVSGYAESLVADHGRLKMGVEFLAKPYSVQQLSQRVQHVLE